MGTRLLRILDISDPSRPREVGHYKTRGRSLGVHASGSHAYVADEYRGKKVTWHEPCHLGRYLGVKEQPRQILKSLKDIEYIEMPDADRCCGMAGTFSLNFYNLSRKIVRRKLDSLESTGADIVLTGCPGCQVQLLDGITQNGMTQKVMHIMDLFE